MAWGWIHNDKIYIFVWSIPLSPNLFLNPSCIRILVLTFRCLVVTSVFYLLLNNLYFIIHFATYSLTFLHQVSIPLLAQLGSISTALLKTPRWETSTGILMKVWVKGSSTGAECCSHWVWRFIPPLQLWWWRVRLLLMWRAQSAGLILNARAESPRKKKQQAKKVVKINSKNKYMHTMYCMVKFAISLPWWR